MELCEKISSSNQNFHFVLKDTIFEILINKIDINVKQVRILRIIYLKILRQISIFTKSLI
jgi:hypothetical protein